MLAVTSTQSRGVKLLTRYLKTVQKKYNRRKSRRNLLIFSIVYIGGIATILYNLLSD